MNGDQLKRLRRKLKGHNGKAMTQRELADLLGYTPESICKWERGGKKAVLPRPAEMLAENLAKERGVKYGAQGLG